MENFVYYGPTKMLFGAGSFENFAEEILPYGKRVLFVYGQRHIKENGIYDKVIKQFKAAGIEWVELGGVHSNPWLDFAHKGIELCRTEKIDFVLGVGGGSTSDTAKTIAAGAKADYDIWESYLDFHTRIPDSDKKHIPTDALPIGVVMTKAGTGSDFDLTAVVTNDKTLEKLILMTPAIYPKFSVCDPTLTYTLPATQTAYGIADMMTHYFEQYFSASKNTQTLDRMKEGILKSIIEVAPTALESPSDYTARSNLMYCSSWSCSAQNITGVIPEWSSHFIEHELTGMLDLNHGLGMAIIYPAWMKYVIKTNPGRFAQYAERVWDVKRNGRSDLEVGMEGIEKTQAFWSSLGIPQTLGKAYVPASKSQEDPDNPRAAFDSSILAKAAKQAVRFGPLGFFKTLDENDVLNILNMAS